MRVHACAWLGKERVGDTCRMCIGKCTLSPGRAFDVDCVPMCLVCALGTFWSKAGVKGLLSCALLLVAIADAVRSCMTDPTLIGCRNPYKLLPRVCDCAREGVQSRAPSVDHKCVAAGRACTVIHAVRDRKCACVDGMLT